MKKFISLMFVLLLALNCFGADMRLDQVLTPDPAVKIRTMKNGLTYYVKQNSYPEKNVSLRLVVRSGSLMENSNQLGLAHFMEHMAFNGTELYPGNSAVDAMEKMGIQFGADVNAYTTYDRTVFMINLPDNSPETIDRGIEILAQFGGKALLDAGEIEKERKVVIEEWRRGKGAAERLRHFETDMLLADSRFVERDPIGSIDVLESFTRDDLVSYYKTWFRPDLMAVVASGDFNARMVEKSIKKHFSYMRSEGPVPAVDKSIPDTKGTVAGVFSDIELPSVEYNFYVKAPVFPQKTVADYRDGLIRTLYLNMLSDRYDELLRKGGQSFSFAGAGFAELFSSKSLFAVTSTLNEDSIEKGIADVVAEIARAGQHGFTQGELDRAKAELMSYMEMAYNERDKTDSNSYADEYIRNFADGEAIPGIETEFAIYGRFLPGITLAQVNAVGEYFMDPDNHVILLSGCNKDDLVYPEPADVIKLTNTVLAAPQTPYDDGNTAASLLDRDSLVPGTVVSVVENTELGITRIKLSNGASVILKPTDFKNDQIVYSAVSMGGNSLVSDSQWPSSLVACSVMANSGLGKLSRTELDKYLKGRNVSVVPYIEDFSEGFTGASTGQDLETAFQMMHLYFTSPVCSREGYDSYMSRMESFLKNQEVVPDVVFAREIRTAMTQGALRGRYLDADMLKDISMEDAEAVFRQRFNDPCDFTFIFTGSFDVQKVTELSCLYLGSIGGEAAPETWKDNGVRYHHADSRLDVQCGNDAKTSVMYVMNGSYDYSDEENMAIDALCEMLNMRLRETIREDMGGTYGISAFPSYSQYPVPEYIVNIYFTCDPDRQTELENAVVAEIEKLKHEIPQEYLDKYKAAAIPAFRKDLRENSFWLSAITDSIYNGGDVMLPAEFERIVTELDCTVLAEKAARYFDTASALTATMNQKK
ncbi:MAG: insulinase family protein [Spirochaetia bacterium]|nr:insulinase family protein [Spirochaetia bacterium]